MNNIYILYKLEKRAETTDTLLYYASKDKGLLEEIILSIWEEAKYLIWNYPDNPIDEGIVVPIGPEDNADSESKEDE